LAKEIRDGAVDFVFAAKSCPSKVFTTCLYGRLLISHSERKASAAICLTLGFCARGQDSARDTPMSNPGLIPTTLAKCTYLNLVLNFASI
jgi:hypothetical protein